MKTEFKFIKLRLLLDDPLYEMKFKKNFVYFKKTQTNQIIFCVSLREHEVDEVLLKDELLPVFLTMNHKLDEVIRFSSFEFAKDEIRKSVWFKARTMNDFWNLCSPEGIYDRRLGFDGNRFISHQCSLHWWILFHNESIRSKVSLFETLRIWLADTLTKTANHGWVNNYWRQGDLHARFYIDGIRLLGLEYRLTKNINYLQAAESAIQFLLKNNAIRNDDQLWILHDNTETEVLSSSCLSFTPDHSYTLNTQLQFINALFLLGDEVHIETKKQALSVVLNLIKRPDKNSMLMNKLIEFRSFYGDNPRYNKIYRKCFNLIFDNTVKSKILSRSEQDQNFVSANGAIRRDFYLSTLSPRYHVINLKDLIILYNLCKESELKIIISRGYNWFKKNYDPYLLKSSSYYYALPAICDSVSLFAGDQSEFKTRVENDLRDYCGGIGFDAHYNTIALLSGELI